MTPRARTVLAAAAARVEDFFLEPAEPEAAGRVPAAPDPALPASRGAPAALRSSPAEGRRCPPLALVPPVQPPSMAAESECAPAPAAPAPATPAALSAAPAAPPAAPAAPPAASALRPVIAVFGLRRRCGCTVVARALAAELAGRDQAGAAAVASISAAAGIPLATAAAGRLAERLADVPGARISAVGRLCLVAGADTAALADITRHFAPLVVDAGGAGLDGEEAAAADHVVLVAGPGIEPAMVRVAAACIRSGGTEPLLVMNRCAASEAGERLGLADSRMGAQLALGGRQARGELGRAIAVVADLCEASL